MNSELKTTCNTPRARARQNTNLRRQTQRSWSGISPHEVHFSKREIFSTTLQQIPLVQRISCAARSTYLRRHCRRLGNEKNEVLHSLLPCPCLSAHCMCFITKVWALANGLSHAVSSLFSCCSWREVSKTTGIPNGRTIVSLPELRKLLSLKHSVLPPRLTEPHSIENNSGVRPNVSMITPPFNDRLDLSGHTRISFGRPCHLYKYSTMPLSLR